MSENGFKEISKLIPKEKNKRIDWAAFEQTELRFIFDRMKNTPQEPKWHGEGDVYTHTKAVCEQLIAFDEYAELKDEEKTVVFLAALLHDVGKTVSTVKDENGLLISPNHSLKGSMIARKLLWVDFDLCGSDERRNFREAVCLLIRYHSFPNRCEAAESDEYELLKIASNGQLTSLFSLKLLCLLGKADILGRICAGREEQLYKVEYCTAAAAEYGCYEGAYKFASDYSQWAYFKGKTKWKEQELFDDTWQSVIMMCGLPGTGKDTYIQNNLAQYPMVSLDALRIKYRISPVGDQTKIIIAAREQAKEYLRKKQPFVYNATNLTPLIRSRQITLFEKYGACVKVCFLETEYEEQLRRNRERANAVPEYAIDSMLSKTVPPQRNESQCVKWLCV